MNFSSICRTCLCDHSLNPLFKDNDDYDTFSKALYMATGIQIQYNDNLPQNMCGNCIIKLNNTLKFRRQCRDAETKLLKQIKAKSYVLTKHCKKSVQNTTNKIYSGMESDNGDDKNFETTIKVEAERNENESPNEYDLDDDMPLKLLMNSEKPNIKISPKYEPTEETLPYDTVCAISDKEVKVEEIKEEKSEPADTSSLKSDPILRDNELNNDNNTNLISINDTANLDNCISSTLSKSSDVNDAPYEVLIDSVTQKATRVLCKLCNKELSVRSIDFHMAKRHPGADERKIKCHLCDTYVMKNKLNRHMIMMHGSGCFKCGYCKLEFANKEQLVEHVGACTAKKRKRKINEAGRELRECDECHKVMQKASLRMHKAVKHAGLKPVCEHCGKSFGNKFRLNEHYRAKHGYEKFQCNYCEFRSAGAMAMKNHERRHRDEKPFVCEECGAKFHAAYLLAQHKQSHRKEKLVKVICLDVSISCMAWLPNNPYVVVLGLSRPSGQLIKLYNVNNGRPIPVDGLTGPGGSVTAITVNQSGVCRIAAGDSDSNVRIWEIPSRRIKFTADDLDY